MYKPSPRRPRRILIGGHPDGALSQVRGRGDIYITRARRVHVGQAFNGYPVAVEVREDGFSYVWFFGRCIGRLRGGVDPSVLPLPDQARDPKHPLLVAATQKT